MLVFGVVNRVVVWKYATALEKYGACKRRKTLIRNVGVHQQVPTSINHRKSRKFLTAIKATNPVSLHCVLATVFEAALSSNTVCQ
jgi:hypothetical protein